METLFRWFTFGLLGGFVLFGLTARAQEPAPHPADSAPAVEQVKPAAEEPIDFNRARTLRQKRMQGEKLTPEEDAYLNRALEARGRRAPSGNEAAPRAGQALAGARESIGQKPLSDMSEEDRYKGEDGGPYGAGRNMPADAHRQAAEAATAAIQPLDAKGQPSEDGKIVLVSISMSNATQEFSMFKRLADADPAKSPRLTIVDCAQGGQAMAEWAKPEAQPWSVMERRLADSQVTASQVQVAWIKLANKSPRGELEEHGRKLQRDTQAVLQIARKRYPNLRIAYLSSRIYGGYSTGTLNPEPYAYESAYVVRWLIQDQVRGVDALNPDPEQGPVTAPLLLWGPYLWADGLTPREKDGLVWKREDLAGDGTHPSQSGREKVARLLLDFFKNDALTRSWFVKDTTLPTAGQ